MTLDQLPPVQPASGVGVLHLFGKPNQHFRPKAMVKVIRQAHAQAELPPEPDPPFEHTDGAVELPRYPQIVTAEILGHKADLGFMVLDFDFWRLRKIQTQLASSGIAWQDSYLSLTEISEYAQGIPAEMRQARLYPQLPPPDKPAWCFYPMSKRRGEQHNWFRLPYEQRKELMYEHGASGRKFAGRVLQVVTGSTGLDDFEWGVTLFCSQPQDLKDVVYTLRYDEGSALYGEFGSFWAGMVAPPEAIAARWSDGL